MMKELELFMDALRAEDFVQGHEILEDQWRAWKVVPEKRDESYILKALINGSTALALWRLGRAEGCYKVWETFEKYRPLILSVDSSYTKAYQEAEAFLIDKYAQIIVKA